MTEKWAAFGWHVLEIDGHHMGQILDALDEAAHIHHKPTVIVAHTVKGKGVSFMENDAGWHGRAPDDDQCTCALDELAREVFHDH
jgi:transketolase